MNIPLIGSRKYEEHRSGRPRAIITITSFEGGKFEMKSSSKDALITLGTLQMAISIVQSQLAVRNQPIPVEETPVNGTQPASN